MVSNALHWRSIGPFRGGRALAVTGVPQFPNRFYFGAVDGGVWETDDAGRTWKPIFDAMRVGSIGAIAVAPSDPNIIYVGTGEADMRSDIALGHGVFKSINAGKTWKFMGLKDTEAIGKIVVDPKNPNKVWLAALGHPYGANRERGVFFSKNGGRTWNKSLYLNPNVGAIDLAIDPQNSSKILASMWQTRRPPWNVYPPSNGPGSGLFETQNDGKTWAKIQGHGFPSQPGRIGIAIAPQNPNIIYALVDSKHGGVYKSSNGGVSWTHICNDVRIWQRGWYFGGISVSPTNYNHVYICNTALYESKTGGKSFSPIKGAPGGDDYHTLWIDPTQPENRILGTDQGVVVSVNRGRTWSSWFNQPTAQIYQVATDNRVPYWVYGAQQDSGALGLPSQTGSIDGINMTNFLEVSSGGESGMMAPDPQNKNLIFGGSVSKTDLQTNFTTSVNPTLAYPGVYRSTWTLPLVFSKANPHNLYFANQFVFESKNEGKTWTEISPDLTSKNPTVPSNLDTSTAADAPLPGSPRGVVYSLAPSPINKNVLWAGTDDGKLWLTTNTGKSWKHIPLKGMNSWSKVTSICASPFDAGDAWVAVDRHRLDDDHPYLYHIVNYQNAGANSCIGIKPNEFLNSVLQDRKNKNVVFAGSESGVYVSLDAGLHWSNLDLNLPATSVRDIVEKDHDLVIATHGRGFYILDDITPLEQWRKLKTKVDGILFSPRNTYLLRYDGFRGSPMPKSEPRGENPPIGVFFDYYLSQPKQNIQLEINFGSKLIAKFSSNTKPAPVRQNRMDIAPGWLKQPSGLQNQIGLNRFVWNFRDSKGIIVPPGTYTAVLAGKDYVDTVKFTILQDPNISMSIQDCRAQYALAYQVQRLNQRIAKVLRDAQAFQKHTLQMKNSAGMNNLEKYIEFPPPPDPRNSVGTPLTNPKSLNSLGSRVRQLFGEIENSESAPSSEQNLLYLQFETQFNALNSKIQFIISKK